MSETVDVEVVFLSQSPNAIRVKTERDRVVNLPKSQIVWDMDATIGDAIEVTMPEWLALEKELI